MKMIDLFSGIGGFSLAAQWCWGDELEIEAFVEIDPFCQKVLRKHWPGVPIYDDIKKIQWVVANSNGQRLEGQEGGSKEGFRGRYQRCNISIPPIDLLTGGFPCQPFSCAGKRAGTEDDRWLWPETIRAIRSIKPRWICLENVTGLVSMVEQIGDIKVKSKTIQRFQGSDIYKGIFSRQELLLLAKIIKDIEDSGYNLPQLKDGTPIIPVIPACAQGAPHRRDRVWIVGHSSITGRQQDSRSPHENESKHEGRSSVQSNKPSGSDCHAPDTDGFNGNDAGHGSGEISQFKEAQVSGCDSADSHRKRLQIREMFGRNFREECTSPFRNPWQENWYEVATRLCRVDDGIPRRVDRVNRLKALGNSIVPQIAYQIFKTIKEIHDCSEEWRFSYFNPLPPSAWGG